MSASKTEFLVEAPFNLLDVDISQDADWLDAFQLLNWDQTPFDMGDAFLELYIRPTYNHPTLFKKLSSLGSGGISIEDPSQGLCHFSIDRAVILADLPIGEWTQFMVMTEDGVTQTEIWRGAMRIHPGIIAA